MKNNEWRNLIEERREELLEAIRKAERAALSSTSSRFVVYLWEDGDISTLEDSAGGNTEYTAAHKCISISEHCHQHWNALDWFGDLDIAIEELSRAMTEEEKNAFDKWAAECEAEQGEAPDEYETLSWIEENCSTAIETVENYVYSEMMAEFDEENIIDEAISNL